MWWGPFDGGNPSLVVLFDFNASDLPEQVQDALFPTARVRD
ncbi:hypothetical protein X741_20280 [Mesorhizobium sp. LNHC229A00]|nr:hypothetical protein X741_20280 [Mesorhizobium sp. LNHC229A00]